MNPENLCPGCMEETQPDPVCSSCGYNKNTPPESLLHLAPGRVLNGKYLLGRVLGHGGFGITYLAYDLTLNLKLAIKEYMPQHLATRTGSDRDVTVYKQELKAEYRYGLDKFLEEARTLARFNEHPNIVTVRDFFEANNTAYLVMNYHQGITLQAYLEKQGGKIAYARAVKLFMPVLDALKEVHTEGILHRDISPDNILISEKGRVILIDFGAARQAITEQSRSISVIMKAGYSPPEQYQSRGRQGPWTDIYAVAATMYRSVTGKAPLEAIDRMAADDLVFPSQLGTAIDVEVERALLKALAVKADDRYQDVEEFQAALLEAETGRGSKEIYLGADERKPAEQLDDGVKVKEPAVVEKQKWEEQKKGAQAALKIKRPLPVETDRPAAARDQVAKYDDAVFLLSKKALKYAAAVILGVALLIGAISLFGGEGGVTDPPGPVLEEGTGDTALLNDEDSGRDEPAQEDEQEDEVEEAEPTYGPDVLAGLDADYYIDYEQGTIPIGDLYIGARVVDPSWEWEFRTGLAYARESGDATKPVTWIVVAKGHYEGLEPHVTLLSEELIGRFPFDNSTDRGSRYGSNHWGESGTGNATRGLRPWLNSTGIHAGEGFYRAFSESFKRAVLITTVPNREWQQGSAYTTSDHVFIPSTTELNDVDHSRTYSIGRVYAYFAGAGVEERVARLGGYARWYWTRSPDTPRGNHVRYVSSAGAFIHSTANYDGYGVRPALNLKSEILVSEISP